VGRENHALNCQSSSRIRKKIISAFLFRNQLTRPAIKKLIREQLFFGGTTFTNEALEKAMGELAKNGAQKDGGNSKSIVYI
jgi:hypothetical protein